MVINQTDELIKRVKHLQNGDISRGMERMGIKYKLNYGVSIPQLRQIATEYNLDNELAYSLLSYDIREAKILASMLIDPCKISIDQLLSISTTVDNLELVEQFSKNIFAQSPDLEQVLPILMDVNYWQIVLSLYSASWYLKINKTANHTIVEWCRKQVAYFADNDDELIQKSTMFLFQSLACASNSIKQEMVNLAGIWLKSEKKSVQNFAQEFLWLNI